MLRVLKMVKSNTPKATIMVFDKKSYEIVVANYESDTKSVHARRF